MEGGARVRRRLTRWRAMFADVARFALLLGIEYSWNVFPATPTSSCVLHVCHAVMLVALWPAHSHPPKGKAE